MTAGTDMSLVWLQPQWFWLGLLVLAGLGVSGWWRQRRIQQAKRRLVQSLGLAPESVSQSDLFRMDSVNTSSGMPWLILWLMTCLIVSLAQPQWRWQQSATDISSMRVLLAIDVSDSMAVRDVSPHRLAAVQSQLQDWLDGYVMDQPQRPYIGLVVYGGQTHWVLPFTQDLRQLQLALSQLQLRGLPTKGSRWANVITDWPYEVNVEMDAAVNSVWWFGDGLNDEFKPIQNPHFLPHSFHWFAVGSTLGGVIPLPSGQQGEWVMDQGQAVMSKVDVAQGRANWADFWLQQGKDSAPTLQVSDLSDQHLQQAYQRLQDQAPLMPGQFHYLALFWLPLMAALMTLMWCWYRRTNTGILRRTMMALPWLLWVMSVGLMLWQGVAVADEKTDAKPTWQGIQDWIDVEDWHSAQLELDEQSLPPFTQQLWQANLDYAQQQWLDAIQGYKVAIGLANDAAQQAQALFNLAAVLMVTEQAEQAYYALQAAQNGLAQSLPNTQSGDHQALATMIYHNLTLARIQWSKQLQQVSIRGDSQNQTEEQRAQVAPVRPSQLLPQAATDSLPGTLDGLAEQVPDEFSVSLTSPDTIAHQIQAAQTLQGFTATQPTPIQASRIYRRLYEWEENYPAPLDEAQTIEGVKPW